LSGIGHSGGGRSAVSARQVHAAPGRGHARRRRRRVWRRARAPGASPRATIEGGGRRAVALSRRSGAR